MDDLYDDLENYNDFAELEVLRKENKELKTKLQEYDLRIDKLQKDFDKVSSEFRNLEINYSSLLKTAKAEIERKTQTISLLNSEKDKLVLNSLQSSNKKNRRRKLSRGRLDNIKKIGDDTDSVKSSKKGLPQDPRNRSLDRNRNEDTRFPSVETASSANSDDPKKNQVETKAFFKDTEGPMKPMSIMNRRKSMPVVSQQKFSSDEEGDENSADEYNRKWPQRENRRKSKPQNEGLGFDDKFSKNYHESPRDNYYPGRFNKSRRARGKFGPSERQKRHFSPDRNRRMEDNEYQRHENRRSRGRPSPPLNRYDSQCRNRNRSRSNYERDNYDDSTQHRQHNENYPFKHKIHGEYEEPPTKRSRIDTSNAYKEDDDVRERERLHRALDSLEEPAYSKNLQYLQHESCQSPDYSNPDVVSPHPVREIKNNAAIKLEDPRLVSIKYVRKSEDDKVVLSTSSGRNVTLKHISLSAYNHDQTPRKQMPKALQEMPSNTEEMIKDIYMDADNPLSNMSLESGELFSEPPSATTPDSFDGKDELDSISKQLQQNHTLTNKLIVENTNNNRKDNPTTSIEDITEYRIPKIKKPDKAISCTVDKNPLALLLNEISDLPEVKAKPVTKSISLPSKNSSKLEVDTVYSKRQADKKKKEINSSKQNKSQTKQSQTSREIVAGDLELTDENSDNVDLYNKTVAEKTESLCAEQVKVKAETITKELNIDNKHKEEIEPKKSLPIIDQTNLNSYKIVEENTDNKKKSKNKAHKQKSSTAKDSKNELNEKNSKPKEEIKAKFNALFGDSSSLITPEDLGLVAVPDPESVLTTSYKIPLFEDAQDAIDVNIEPEPNKTTVETDEKQTTKIKACKSTKLKKNIARDEITNTTQNFAIDMTVEPKPNKTAVVADEQQIPKNKGCKSSKPNKNLANSDATKNTQNFAIDVTVEPKTNKMDVEIENQNPKIRECKSSKSKKNCATDGTMNTQNFAIDVTVEPKPSKIAVETDEKQNTKIKECKSSKSKKNTATDGTINTQNFAIDVTVEPKTSKMAVETDEKRNTRINECKSSSPKKNIASDETTNTQNFAIDVTVVSKPSKIAVATDEKQNSNIKECKSSKPKKNIPSDITTNTPNLIITLDASDDKDNNVVNTVIISTGVQPQIAEIPSQIMPDPVSLETTKEHNKLDILKDQPVPIALATSTPHKNLLINDIGAVNSQSLGNTCIRADIKEVQYDTSSRTSFNNGLDSQSVPDAPDVRIFVKRRKKLIKKT